MGVLQNDLLSCNLFKKVGRLTTFCNCPVGEFEKVLRIRRLGFQVVVKRLALFSDRKYPVSVDSLQFACYASVF